MNQLLTRLQDASHLMPRNRLFLPLFSHPPKKIFLLVAGAGYGKTSLLTSFFHHHPQEVRWITLSRPFDNLQSMIAALPDLDEEKPKWIVIDQLENLVLDAIDTKKFVLWIEELPSNTTLVLSGRKLPKRLPIIRWKVQGLATIYNKDKLAFTFDEIKDLMKYANKKQLSNYKLRELSVNLEGWPAGLALFNENAIRNISNWSFLQSLNFPDSSSDLYHYIENEIVVDIPTTMRSFLMYVSLFRCLSKPILQNFLPDYPIQDLTKDIGNTQLFLSSNREGGARLHPLFRTFFYRLAEQEWGSAKMKSYHQKIAILYREDYQFFEALYQALSAYDEKLAAEIINELVERYEPIEFIQLLDGWFEKLSPSLELSRMSLFLFRCIPVELASRLIVPLKAIAKRYEEANSPIYADFCHRLAHISFYQGELKEAVHYYKESLNYSKGNENGKMNALNLSMLAQTYRFMNDSVNAFLHTRKALAISEKQGFKQSQMHALWMMAELLIDKGELKKSRKFTMQAIHISREIDETSIIYPLCTISRYYRKMKQPNEAISWVNQAIEQSNKFGIPADKGWAIVELALCKQAIGNIDEAQELMEEAVQIFENFRHHVCLIQRKLLSILRIQGKAKEAECLEKKINHNANELGYTWLYEESVSIISAHPTLSINVLGPLLIEIDGKVAQIKRRASLHLLLLLVTNIGRKWSKNELIGALFPEEEEGAASNQLYVALSVLRKQLEPGLRNGRESKFITHDGSFYSFQFKEAVIDIENLFQRLSSSYSPENLAEVKQLYKGGLLTEYPHEEWLFDSRLAIQEKYLQTLRSWALYCKQQSQYEEAIEILEVIIKMEPFDEKSHLDYARLLYETGKIGKSRRAVTEAVNLFERELDVDMRTEFNKVFLPEVSS